MGSNPTVTARKPPVYRGFFLAQAAREKELRRNGSETAVIEPVDRTVVLTTVERIYALKTAESR